MRAGSGGFSLTHWNVQIHRYRIMHNSHTTNGDMLQKSKMHTWGIQNVWLLFWHTGVATTTVAAVYGTLPVFLDQGCKQKLCHIGRHISTFHFSTMSGEWSVWTHYHGNQEKIKNKKALAWLHFQKPFAICLGWRKCQDAATALLQK